MEDVEAIKNRIISEAEELVSKTFPLKIAEIDTLVKSEQFSNDRVAAITTTLSIPVPDPIVLNNHAERNPKRKRLNDDIEGTPVFCLPTGSVSCNKHLVYLTELLKPLICVLIEHCNTLKMWIQLLIPRIEDGNNFGVSIQEDTLAELRQVESDAAAYLDQITRYFITRGKLVSKVAKYPHVEDYRKSVEEIDQKEFFNLRLTCTELRNTYLSVADMIEKNKEKIKKPRNSNAEALY